MHWILQDNLFNEQAYQTLLDTLVRFNIPHSIHKVIPFIGELTPEPEFDTNNIICMGSYSLRHCAKKNGWYPGVFDLEPFDFQVQLEHWGEHMLNYDSVVSKFKDAKFIEDEMFVRPIEDSKVFAGKVMNKDDFEKWQHSVVEMKEDYGQGENFGDTLIQVSPIKEIYAEYRFWIVKQKIVTASRYKIGNKVLYSSDIDQRIYNYVTKILRIKNRIFDPILSVHNNGWEPHEAFVLDVCETSEGMKVVEINTLNAAGFYAANITDLVMSLENTFSV